MRTYTCLVLLLLSFGFSAKGGEPQSATGEKTIRLPEFQISESMKLRPEEKWLTGRLGNFEIFSDASERETRDFITKFYKFHLAFTYLFPKANSLAREKVVVVLCGSLGKFRELTPLVPESNFQTIGSVTACDDFSSYLVINLDIKSAFQAANMGDGLEGQHTGTEFVDGEELARREYIHLLLSHSQPRPPAWLEEGISRYFSSIKVSSTRISYAQLTKEITYFFHRRRMLSMPELFATTYDSPEANLSVGGVFSNQSLTFVHYGMFAYKMRYQKAFLEFVDHAAKEPVTEEMFRKAFKMSYSEMEAELLNYVEGGFYRHAVAPKTKQFPDAPKFPLRATTDAENGRIKGDTLRLVKRYDDARIEYISPIMRKHADARLLGSIGMLDYQTKNLVAARKFLEEAVAAKTDDPATYFTLARMRYEEALSNIPDGKLSPDQLASVLTPLFAALELKQPHIEIYTLIADAWLHSQSSPTLDNLVVLDQGVMAFPRNAELIYKNATLKARYGFIDDAHSLIELGLKVTRDDGMKTRFENLRTALPERMTNPIGAPSSKNTPSKN
jgi:hypothetical protein